MRDIMLIFHFLGLAMALGNAFGQLFLGIVASKMTIQESAVFQEKIMFMNYMGKLGLVFLVLSGGYLMTPYWGAVFVLPGLFSKLVLVAIIIVTVVLSSFVAVKVKKEGGEKNLARMRNLNFFSLLLSLIVVVLAVSIFH